MANTHTLKTDIAAYDAVARGDKNFEVRKDDRLFQAGDTVILQPYDNSVIHSGFQQPQPAPPPGQQPQPAPRPSKLSYRIGFVLRGGQYGIEPGYVAFSLIAPGDF